MQNIFGITISYPDGKTQTFESLFIDYNGTLAKEGCLLHGVKQKLRLLSPYVNIFVLTADTFGTVKKELGDLPIKIMTVSNGTEKAEFLKKHGRGNAIAIGNGNNDVAMFKESQLSIGIIGPEGFAPKLMEESTIIVHSIINALELLLVPKCITATLRD